MSGRHCTDAELLTWEQAGTLAARLPGLRGARGWTVTRLAREAGVLPEAARRAGKGSHRTALAVAGKLAAALGVTLGELTGPGPDGELTGKQQAGREIRRLRRERGWSQAALAAEAGLSQSVAGRAENGDQAVTDRTLSAIARVLGTTLADLTGGAP